MSWSADISYLVKRRSNFTKKTFSFFWAIHKCPLNFEVEGKDESFWHRGALSLNSSKYQQCRGYFPRNVIFNRCASISWFQVVTQWVSYFFLQLAHLRVFQIIFSKICSDTETTLHTADCVDFYLSKRGKHTNCFCKHCQTHRGRCFLLSKHRDHQAHSRLRWLLPRREHRAHQLCWSSQQKAMSLHKRHSQHWSAEDVQMLSTNYVRLSS